VLLENRNTLEKSSSRFSLIQALDASPQDLQTSDLNYTVSAAGMGYFVDDRIRKLLEKAARNLSSSESIRFAFPLHECIQ
jgi:hypothetical protein